MKDKKKGIAHKKDNTQTHIHYSKIEKICLLLFVIFVIMFLGGYRLGNQPMKFIGLGIGVTTCLVQAHINLEEE